jgi:integrase
MRRRRQSGQLITTEHGYAVRFYEPGDGKRRRVQKWLGDFKTLPTDTAAKNAMDAVLFNVNQNATALPQTNNITFRAVAKEWIEDCPKREDKPVKQSVLKNWQGILDNHLLPQVGDKPLSEVGNKNMRPVIDRLRRKGLKPATIQNVLLVAKLVRAFPTDDDGVPLFPIKWNRRKLNLPKVEPINQVTPSFKSEEITKIVTNSAGRLQMACILFAATGLRAGELFGLECKHFDGTAVEVKQAVWGNTGKVQTPKTINSYRVVDLAPAVATLLQQFIGERKSGFIFRTRNGGPLNQADLLRRELKPLLDVLGIPRMAYHAFRRYRNTFLRQAGCPSGIQKYWLGHTRKQDMSDVYDKSHEDVGYRRDLARAMGTGFELPATLTLGVNGRREQAVETELTVAE